MPRPQPVVLVIEDQPELGNVLGHVLGTAGFDVVQVRTTADALAALGEQEIEFIVSDVVQAADATDDSASTLNAAFPDVPVIVIRDERDDDVPFFGAWRRDGRRIMLRRPFRLDDLLSASREIYTEQRPTG